MAGAGTGKTHTLVERCLNCLLTEKPPASIDEILMVTFTEAAAAEMRRRVRNRLLDEIRGVVGDDRWQEQAALFETAHFGTLHSFCFQLVRQHFYQLELDPQVAVMPQEEAQILAEETLNNLFQGYYSAKDATAQAVQRLIQTHSRGWEVPIRSLVLRLHQYSQSLPNAEAWIQSQLNLFAAPEPTTWRHWWERAMAELPQQWLLTLSTLSPKNKIAAQSEAAVRQLTNIQSPDAVAAAFREIASIREKCPRGKKAAWLDPLEGFFGEVEFFASLIGSPEHSDPLGEDWRWARDQMITLLELAREFSRSFLEAKRELAVVDFNDLEQYALRLLWDETKDRPTSIARHWREKLRFIFVDEYQDINAAQDQMIKALAREGIGSNRFLVGDVKQSIYRFRLANPRIFQGYAQQWQHDPHSQVLPLVDNFRSTESLLDFVNSFFGLFISHDLGGVDYSIEAALQFGAADERSNLSSKTLAKPAVQLHLLLKSRTEAYESEEETAEGLGEILELQQADKEARLVALRLRELHSHQHPVWDEQAQCFRPIDWKDMAILLRSPARKAESYAKEFARLNLPLQVARGKFYKSIEISDLLSLLQLLDNPLQDLPLLAVLHSPLVGLSANDLAEIRLASVGTRFWVALNRWHQIAGTRPPQTSTSSDSDALSTKNPDKPTVDAYAKIAAFLQRFSQWRRQARQASLSNCLETILAETRYSDWVLTQSRGAQRQANIQRFVNLVQRFDRFQRQGLFRFLRWVEAQQAVEIEPEVPASTSENAVRLMSIHQSKGLEFPLVVVADLGKPFNMVDLRAEIILDEQYGLCPQIKPPHTGKRYPSVAYWLAQRHQLREMLGEELRLLYVAMTRARDTLILTGSLSNDKLSGFREKKSPPANATVLAARSCIDWVGLWFSVNAGLDAKDKMQGESPLLHWFVHDQTHLLFDHPQNPAPQTSAPQIDFQSETWRQLQNKLAWQYPFSAATQQPAKTSVTALRRQAAAFEEYEAKVLFDSPGHTSRNRVESEGSARFGSPATLKSELTAIEVGNAHHAFLQLLSVDRATNSKSLRQEAQRLQSEGLLTLQQTANLNFDSLAHFWNSELGKRIRLKSEFMHRELAFTSRFTPGELSDLLGQPNQSGLKGEFVLVQGVVDLAIITPSDIWLIDFKTDELRPDGLAVKAKAYAPQLRLYATALSKIYQRPVSEAWLYFIALRQAVAL
jgi:ATP-dependent helicase/nuclease subunit A